MLTTLAAVRRAKKITQVQLSKLTGIPQTTISMVETGTILPSGPIRKKLSEALGIAEDWVSRDYSEYILEGHKR